MKNLNLKKFKRWLKTKRIGVLYGGTSAERDISILSGKAVMGAIARLGCKVLPVDPADDFIYNIRRSRLDLAFLALHGPLGEDGTVQGLLEALGIPYTGSRVLASALAMNKIMTKQIFAANGIPTPLTYNGNNVQFPCVVKPALQGSAIGVGLVKRKGQYKKAVKNALKYGPDVLVEEYVPGKEITVGILGDEALPPVEIVPVHDFYDFHSKYSSGGSKHIVPARLPAKIMEAAKNVAVAAHKALGCKAFSRVDIIIDAGGNSYVLEVNTIPGLTKTSLLPDAAKASGIDFDELIFRMMYFSWSAKLV